MRSLWIPLLAVTACDAYSDPGYVGDPLFEIGGTFVSSRGTPEHSEMAVAWQATTGLEPPASVPCKLAFPAAFTLRLIEPPPDAALVQLAGEPPFAEGYVFVIAAPGAPHAGDTLGTDYHHAIAYLTADVAAGSQTADYLGGPLPAGFHLMTWTAGAPRPSQRALIDRCVALGADAARCMALRQYVLDPAPPSDKLAISLVAR